MSDPEDEEDAAVRDAGDENRTIASVAGPLASEAETIWGDAATASAAGPPELAQLRELLSRPTAERLKVLGPLGKGGMAHVELVIDAALERRLAAKVMAPVLRDDPHAVELFVREAQITAQLDHPAVVPVHELWADPDGHLHFTMKVVEGETLAAYVDRRREENARDVLLDVLEILVKICDALAFAHNRGVVHSDLKPENVMIGTFGEVYLMDWGLARAPWRPEHGVGSGSIAGTPAYMAPEQAGSGRIDERSDVFGAGALLYFSLTGRAVHGGGTVEERLARAQRCAVVAPSLVEGAAATPPALERIVMKALSREPADRYATMVDLRDALKEFQRGGGGFERRLVPTGEHILREGDEGLEVYYLERGRAEAYRGSGDERVVLGEMPAGEVFGEMAILTSSQRTASVVAIEDCLLVVVTPEALEREMSGMKPWMAALTRTLARRFREREDSAD